MPSVAYLSVRTFVGCPGVYRPSHYWGTLKSGSTSVELTHRLNAVQAKKVHDAECEAEVPAEPTYQTGDEVDFFFTRGAVLAAAKRTWLAVLPEAVVLIDQIPGSLDPAPVLAIRPGWESLGERLIAAYESAEKAGFWEGDEAAMTKASDAWDQALEEHEVTT